MTASFEEVDRWFNAKGYSWFLVFDGYHVYRRRPGHIVYQVLVVDGQVAMPLWRAIQVLVLQNEEFGI